MVDFVNPYRRETNRSGDFLAENLSFGVALVGVLEHARDYAVAVEGLSVGEVGGRCAGVGGGIVPAAFGEFLSGALFEFVGVWWVERGVSVVWCCFGVLGYGSLATDQC